MEFNNSQAGSKTPRKHMAFVHLGLGGRFCLGRDG